MATASTADSGTLRGWLDEQFGDLLWQLSNFWFGMTLLGIWGFMTLLGVVIDQGKDPASYFDAYPAPLVTPCWTRYDLPGWWLRTVSTTFCRGAYPQRTAMRSWWPRVDRPARPKP